MFSVGTHANLKRSLCIWMLLALAGCNSRELPPVNPYEDDPIQVPVAGITPAQSMDYATNLSFDPVSAKYFDSIDKTFDLTPEESALLEQNGFLVSDRLAFTDFTTAYAYIYWKDLPVLVTTDSILHSVHKTYDDLLFQVEVGIIKPKLTTLLEQARHQIQIAAKSNSNSKLTPLYKDLEIYFTVPLELLSGNDGAKYDTPGTEPYVSAAEAADRILPVTLFDTRVDVDFTQFKPRGHYTLFEESECYFRAMSWLAHVEFRFVDYTRGGKPEIQVEPLLAAILARDAIEQSGGRPNWDEIDLLLGSLIGRSDNVDLNGLDRLLKDADIDAPLDLLKRANADRALQLILTNDYGQQRITGQVLMGRTDDPQPIARPVSFMLLGKRFTVDSYLMSNLVYDRLVVDGEKIERPLPSPLDVMYVLGNDRAAAHLQGELERYGYGANLVALRNSVSNYESDFWSGNVYNQWLSLIRKLNTPTTAENYPKPMRTAAWADKMLHTQLSSWAQLRHDNILYSKQSYTFEPLCEYPAGYVEPYPEFYEAVQDYAKFGQALFNQINPNNLTEMGQETYQMAMAYFEKLESIAGQLQTLAEKELRLEPFSPQEELFLKSIAIRQLEQVDNVCAIFTRETWNGWYVDLFPWQDDNPALIVDIHTNTNTEFPSLLPPGVLHIGTGSVAAIVILVNTDEGVVAYVGPSFTYFEIFEEGHPPHRLTDEEWDQRLQNTPRPIPPIWTSSFRLPSVTVPDFMDLP